MPPKPLPRCGKNHPLKLRERKNHTCDHCNTHVKDCTTYACPDCDFDVCQSCYHKSQLESLPSDVRNYTGRATVKLVKVPLNPEYLESSAGELPDVGLEHWICYIHLVGINKYVRIEYGGRTGRILPGGKSAADCVDASGEAFTFINEDGDYVEGCILSEEEYLAEIAELSSVPIDGCCPDFNMSRLVRYSITHLGVKYCVLNHNCQDFVRGVVKDVLSLQFEQLTQVETANAITSHLPGAKEVVVIGVACVAAFALFRLARKAVVALKEVQPLNLDVKELKKSNTVNVLKESVKELKTLGKAVSFVQRFWKK